MPGNIIETADEAIAISDPGEKNRDEHVWGDRLVIRVGQCCRMVVSDSDDWNRYPGGYP